MAKECDPAIETMFGYKRGVKNLASASQVLSLQTGLKIDLSAIILKSMKRDNIIPIMGSSNDLKGFREPTKSEVRNSDCNFEGGLNDRFDNS